MNINISAFHNRGELAYWIGKPYWGKGYGTEAAQATLPYGFEQLKLQKIFAEAYTSNPGSWRRLDSTMKKHSSNICVDSGNITI
ncbi:GNAT family N-acetyltransferase [Paenibacillus alvei]|uniref:GNAT family N-acetyltransferase n=1 Tax=Paenibacillus alvei TaxID=44250 RepID=UPI0009DAADE3|nr:GNAT family N-acetyltransferase [Paenibacillus alvei]